MWLEVDADTFAVRQHGFDIQARDGKTLYVSPGVTGLNSVDDLTSAEYAQAVEVDARNRAVRFGRDYLGHFPLLYAYTDRRLFVTDELTDARQWLQRQGVRLTVAEEALALYFAMGYVPQGMTVFKEISTCENTHVYRWQDRKLSKLRTFTPVEPDERFPLEELRTRIDSDVQAWYRSARAVDVWCSGGLDSSIMAYCFNTGGRKADLLTLSYSQEATAARGEGEIPFARHSASSCAANLRYVELNRDVYREVYERFVQQHVNPVIDYVVPPKYALARASRDLAITGEGGDPLFSGVKNNMVLYTRQQYPSLPLGWIYAMAHKRFAGRVEQIFKRGSELRRFVTDYLEGLFAFYPGELTRKLFYLNTLVKQGGLILPKSYYAGKRYGVRVRHPLTALAVYDAAFRLPDAKKYSYPKGKLALIELYKKHLPATIVERKKSGTRLYLDHYLGYLLDGKLDLDALRATEMFDGAFLARHETGTMSDMETLLAYALHTLNSWLKNNGDSTYEQPIPPQTRHHHPSMAGR